MSPRRRVPPTPPAAFLGSGRLKVTPERLVGDHQPSLATLERLARAGILRVRLDERGTVVERLTA